MDKKQYEDDIQQIKTKLQALLQLDQKRKSIKVVSNVSTPQNSEDNQVLGITTVLNKRLASNYQKQQQQQQEIIYTKSDICKQISKLNPYLQPSHSQSTNLQIQQKQNKEMSWKEYNILGDMITYYSQLLCNQLSQVAQLQSFPMRQGIEKQGWIFQLFYRFINSKNAPQLQKIKLQNGYAVLTQQLQIYHNLTFHKRLLKISLQQIKWVKYIENREFQIIQIKWQQGILQVGFINDNQLKLFEKMFFLQKNMARASSTRLFQNHLLKSIYSQYEV